MNAILEKEDYHLQLDYVLRQLYLAVKGLGINTIQEVVVPFSVGEPEDLNEYLYTFAVLDERNVIEKYTEESSWQEEIEIDNASYVGRMPIYVSKFKFKLKPKVLIKYMEDTSRIPKYTLEFNNVKSKVILNERYVLSTPDYDGVSYTFLNYAIDKSGKIIRKEDFSKEAGQKNIKKIKDRDIRSILENLLKHNELIKVFFPRVSKDSALFRNNVTAKDLVGEKIKEKTISDFLETSDKITRIKPH